MLQDRPLTTVVSPPKPLTKFRRSSLHAGVCFLCMFALLLCILLSPILFHRMSGDMPVLKAMTTGQWLDAWSWWFPARFQISSPLLSAHAWTNNIELFAFVLLSFSLYGWISVTLWRNEACRRSRWVRALLWIGIISAGLVLVATPAMLSADLFVYADYGNTIVSHHANPYFVPPRAVSHDTLTQLDSWSYSVSAYGPVWLGICTLFAWLIGLFGHNPIHYIFAFRLFAFSAHLLNTFLIGKILAQTPQTQRLRIPGMFLYAWNPLLLIESCLGAHNDVQVCTLLLLGILLALQAERKATFPFNWTFALSLVAFAMAALIKLTSIPIILFLLLMLFRKAMPLNTVRSRKIWFNNWPARLSAFKPVLFVSLIYGGTILLWYLPYWFGHNIHEITYSFSAPPTSYYAQNSLLRLVLEWIKHFGLPPQTSLTYWPIYLLSLHPVWTCIDIIIVGSALLVGCRLLWRVPTLTMLAPVTVLVIGAWLIVTTWFYPWYIFWPFGLAVAALTSKHAFAKKLTLGFMLSYSAAALLLYVDLRILPFGDWIGLHTLLLLAPPILTTGILWLYLKRGQLASHQTSYAR